jgi:hypothetical protein
MKIRVFIEGSILCEATDTSDSEAFDAVRDGVSADMRVHRSELEHLEWTTVEEEPEEALASVDVGAMAEDLLSRVAFQEQTREEFEAEHGIDVFDCSTWPDDLVRDMVLFLDAWVRGDGDHQDYEALLMARGLGLVGRESTEDEPEEILDRGRLLLLGWRAGKQGAEDL